MIKSLINGQLGSNISIEERAFQYGDGVFETIAVSNKMLQFWSEHFLRLVTSCDKLGITPPEETALLNDIRKLVTENGQFVLKIIVSRGRSGRGYLADSLSAPSIVITLNSWPDALQKNKDEGVMVRTCQHRLVINPALAGIKHLNRLDQVIARNEWHNNDYAEGIMLDLEDNLLEGTASNLFVRVNNQWQTASKQECAVAGIVRGFVIQAMANKNNACIEKKLNKSELSSVQEMFVCNSVWGIVPVIQCDELMFSIGNDTRELQKEFELQVDTRSYVI